MLIQCPTQPDPSACSLSFAQFCQEKEGGSKRSRFMQMYSRLTQLAHLISFVVAAAARVIIFEARGPATRRDARMHAWRIFCPPINEVEYFTSTVMKMMWDPTLEEKFLKGTNQKYIYVCKRLLEYSTRVSQEA